MLVKFLGLGLIFLSSACFGLYKSSLLNLRAKKLGRISDSLKLMAEHIRIGGRELKKLLELCFKDAETYYFNGKCRINRENLNDGDIKLLEEFFDGFGRLDTKAEYNRTKAFIMQLEQRHKEALRLKAEHGKLYKTLGFSIGLGLCIFLL